MVDPRIYRAAWVIVFVALVVFGFSLEDRPGGAAPQLAPNVTFGSAAANATALADAYGAVTPGSVADTQMASHLAGQLRAAGGFTVSTQTDPIRTADGEQAVETVEAERPGLGQGTVVVIAPRDAAQPGAAEPAAAGAAQSGAAGATERGAADAVATAPAVAATAASAVLVDLADAMSGATLDRSLLLISTSGTVGSAATARLAHALAGDDVDAVIVLGDLAGAVVRQPVVVPWSGTDRLASPVLTATLDRSVHAELGLATGYPSFGSELAQLAFPFATGPQAPFAAHGIPAVELSRSGDRIAEVGEPVDTGDLAKLGTAVAEAVSALDVGAAVPAPSAYLTVSASLIPLWAVRLLVLGLILPVACALVDAVARARRRGHSILSWIVWVLASIVPFVVGLVIVALAGVTHVIPALPGAVGTGVRLSVAGGVVIVVALVAVAAAFRQLRPVGVQVASGIGWRRTPTSPVIEGAVIALSVVMCGLTLVVWAFNPFAAALLVPALHLWLWLGSPGVVARRLAAATLVLGGLILPALVAVYVMLTLGLTPWAFAWSLTVALAGGAIPLATGLSWCVALGVLAGSVFLLARASSAAASAAQAPITVRGPAGYAGPGSLGGTESALRR
jgi:hypothetical protein